MQQLVEVLVISSSPTIREGLQSLALALPNVKAVYTANCDPQSLLGSDDAAPSLILLDCTLPLSQYKDLLLQVKLHWPRIKSVMLVDTEEDRIQMEYVGVDLILRKGTPAVKLLAILKLFVSNEFS